MGPGPYRGGGPCFITTSDVLVAGWVHHIGCCVDQGKGGGKWAKWRAERERRAPPAAPPPSPTAGAVCASVTAQPDQFVVRYLLLSETSGRGVGAGEQDIPVPSRGRKAVVAGSEEECRERYRARSFAKPRQVVLPSSPGAVCGDGRCTSVRKYSRLLCAVTFPFRHSVLRHSSPCAFPLMTCQSLNLSLLSLSLPLPLSESALNIRRN